MAREMLRRLAEKRLFKRLADLRHKLRFWRIVGRLTIIALLVSVFFIGREFIRDYSVELKIDTIDKEAPYAKEVKAIIKPLRYSALTRLEQPDVWIELDFVNKTWILHNINRFDSDGNIVLADGYSGICDDLAIYVYQKIKSLFGSDYKIEFISVTESSYFMARNIASHIVLSISKPGIFFKKTYILDPSFRRYGPMGPFEDYLFNETMSTSHMLNTDATNELYKVGQGIPLLIKKHHLIQLYVDGNGGKFDKDNFVIAITATERYKFAGRYVFALRKNNGKLEQLENKRVIKELLGDKGYAKLRNKILEFFKKYE